MTSNRRPAWERGAGAEEPRRVSGGSRASGPGGGRVAAAGPLCPSRWARASDRSARRFPPSGLREGTPSRLRPPARLERANRAAVRARRGPQCLFRVCCRGFPGTRLALPRPLPQGFVLTGNVLPGDVCDGGGGVFLGGRAACADSGAPLEATLLRGQRRECRSGPGSNPWPLADGVCFPKLPLSGAPPGLTAEI